MQLRSPDQTGQHGGNGALLLQLRRIVHLQFHLGQTGEVQVRHGSGHKLILFPTEHFIKEGRKVRPAFFVFPQAGFDRPVDLSRKITGRLTGAVNLPAGKS